LTKKITDKDKKDWENFLKSNEQLSKKDLTHPQKKRFDKIKRIDLHGFTLDEANETIKNFINKCFNENVTKIVVITGKGLHSKNIENPYISKDSSILKYSVPEFIKSNKGLSNMIIKLSDATTEDGGSGAFYIYIKNKFK
tara:strand:+ start:4793 stop:5212 length:420 start_codon:yes stop_codon:yes gene_type:complete